MAWKMGEDVTMLHRAQVHADGVLARDRYEYWVERENAMPDHEGDSFVRLIWPRCGLSITDKAKRGSLGLGSCQNHRRGLRTCSHPRHPRGRTQTPQSFSHSPSASTPTKACARFCSSSPMKSARPATPTAKGSTSRSRELCCRSCKGGLIAGVKWNLGCRVAYKARPLCNLR
jgi:hypothetical protein